MLGNGNPLPDSYLKNPMYRGAWRATAHGVAKEADMTEHTAPSPIIYKGKESEKGYIYMNPFALHLKLAQHVKQLYFNLKKKVSFPQGSGCMLDVFLEIPWRSEGLRVPFGRETVL